MESKNQKLLFFILGLLAGFGIYYFLSSILFPIIITPVFSPDNSNLILSEIHQAQKSIDIEMYLITSDEVLSALKQAYDRGVKVRIILEKRVIANDNSDAFNQLLSYGIDVKWASEDFQLTHSKFLIIDGKKVIVGSHNWSNAAMKKNREASVIVQDANTVQEFEKVFEGDWERN
ncbi:MAG: phospholipase D-like domain-containing protein [Candidatus Micrarchaeota archaeon]|nr:phospholipase D-like domain-containing protein [Candidatus Micrarchaeota archaeon]